MPADVVQLVCDRPCASDAVQQSIRLVTMRIVAAGVEIDGHDLKFLTCRVFATRKNSLVALSQIMAVPQDQRLGDVSYLLSAFVMKYEQRQSRQRGQ